MAKLPCECHDICSCVCAEKKWNSLANTAVSYSAFNFLGEICFNKLAIFERERKRKLLLKKYLIKNIRNEIITTNNFFFMYLLK